MIDKREEDMSDIISSTYEIIGKIGAGGGGNVYLARHLRLDKKVVLKADKRDITTRAELLRKEVDVLKELNIERIPRVYDFFVEDNTVYTAMDYIDGESLDKPLKRGETFSQKQVIDVAKQLLKSLEKLHEPVHGEEKKGFVHGDIKPANLMLTRSGEVYLIDFNIALALGDTHAIGKSFGYSSPEHYGLDFSTNGSLGKSEKITDYEDTELTEVLDPKTDVMDDKTEAMGANELAQNGKSQSSRSKSLKRKISPDVRSDIYSVGATLYHLLSGERPAKDAIRVTPLSKDEFNPLVVDIITKSMNPNPDLRYQTAGEMLEAFRMLRKQDIRYRRWEKRKKTIALIVPLLMVASVCVAFVGLKRIQVVDRYLRIKDDAQIAYDDGDRETALRNLLDVYDKKKNILTPDAPVEMQYILTEVLESYNLQDSYRYDATVSLPGKLQALRISDDSSTAACLCAGNIVIVDLNTGSIRNSYPCEDSALSEVEYLDSDTIVFAGKEGIQVRDISTDSVLWSGKPATGIAVSGDRSTIAAVYKDDDSAVVYDANDGTVKSRIDFGGKKQKKVINDVFMNPLDNVFCLNWDGNMLGVSFEDGSLCVKDISDASGDNEIEIFDGTEDYKHIEGFFTDQYFVFSGTAVNKSDSVFAIIDMEKLEQAGGFSQEGYYFTDHYGDSIFVGIDNILVEIDPVSGEQKPLINASKNVKKYSSNGNHTVIYADNMVQFFDSRAREIGSVELDSEEALYLGIGDQCAVIGNMDKQELLIMRFDEKKEYIQASYDPKYEHSEARINELDKTIMLFRYDKFRICDFDGNIIADVELPNAKEVYDQQFRKMDTGYYLEVFYNDGKIDRYDAGNGELLETIAGERPDPSLCEVFETADCQIISEMNTAPKLYDKKSGKLISELEINGYLTYITELNEYIIAQNTQANGGNGGYILNKKWEKLAYLPYLSDISQDLLVFDYPDGSIRMVKIYSLDELLNRAHLELT